MIKYVCLKVLSCIFKKKELKTSLRFMWLRFRYSDCSSAKKGGDLGLFGPGN